MPAWTPYIVPFGLFALLTYAGELFSLSPGVIYPVKTVTTGMALYYFKDAYKGEIKPTFDGMAIAAGILVFLLWIGLDPFYPKIEPKGFNPAGHAAGAWLFFLIGFRIIGAALIVPVMEEVFWRSFVMRYLISSSFKNVGLGTFTWFSFVVVSLAFGVEHHRWLAGIAAGAIYGWLLVRSRNLWSPVLAHGVTNALLAVYVLATKNWIFW